MYSQYWIAQIKQTLQNKYLMTIASEKVAHKWMRNNPCSVTNLLCPPNRHQYIFDVTIIVPKLACLRLWTQGGGGDAPHLTLGCKLQTLVLNTLIIRVFRTESHYICPFSYQLGQ